tara:strand:+ start:58171 stop:58326 length:156 start_codon:yes stop_codon:yes gene_type:complete
MKLDLTQEELDLLKKALSYLSSNVPDAEEAFDENISLQALESLSKKLFGLD